MRSVMGIDAAWTAERLSGVALVAKGDKGPWRCVCVVPSYSDFIEAAEGKAIPWDAPACRGGAPNVGRLLSAASRLLGGHAVDVVTVDMPSLWLAREKAV